MCSVISGYNPQVSQPQMSLSVDPKNVYNPPSSLQYPGGVEEGSPVRPESPPSTSSSHSDLSSPSFNRDSELELNPKMHEGSQSTNVSIANFSCDLFSWFFSFFLFLYVHYFLYMLSDILYLMQLWFTSYDINHVACTTSEFKKN